MAFFVWGHDTKGVVALFFKKCTTIYGWQEWVDFLQIAIENQLAEDRDLGDHEMLMKDKGNYLGFIQLTATKL